jgi:hypothetical protein
LILTEVDVIWVIVLLEEDLALDLLLVADALDPEEVDVLVHVLQHGVDVFPLFPRQVLPVVNAYLPLLK